MIQILFMSIWIFSFVLHFPRWGIRILLWGIQIFFPSFSSVSVLHWRSWNLLLGIRISCLVSKIFIFTLRDLNSLSRRFESFIGADLLSCSWVKGFRSLSLRFESFFLDCGLFAFCTLRIQILDLENSDPWLREFRSFH